MQCKYREYIAYILSLDDIPMIHAHVPLLCDEMVFLNDNPTHMTQIPKCNIDYDKNIDSAEKMTRNIAHLG